MAEPRTPGYEITRFEVRAFMAALGLDPREVDSLVVRGNRVIADLSTGEIISVHIKESRS